MKHSHKIAALNQEQRKFVEELFIENYKLLSKRIYELLKNVDPDSTEDCLSNLFLTLCLSADRVMKHENPTAWMFLTAKYICLKHIRNIGTETKRNIPLDENLAETIPYEQSPEEKIIEDIIWSQWNNIKLKERLLSELTENEREILRLSVESGLTNEEIGKLLNKSPDSVRFTLYYIRKKITKKIYSDNF